MESIRAIQVDEDKEEIHSTIEMSDPTSHQALRVVLGHAELEELTALRAKVKELELWRAGKELPEIGKYYIAEESLIESHGFTFDEGIAFRYDGTQMVDSTTCLKGNQLATKKLDKPYLAHIFTAPYTHDIDDSFGRVGWIKFKFETHELHQVSELEDEWSAFHHVLYLDENNTQKYF